MKRKCTRGQKKSRELVRKHEKKAQNAQKSKGNIVKRKGMCGS
jgi:hypothetical protein